MVLCLNYNHLIYLIIIINLFLLILANIHYEMRQYSFLNEITIKIIGTDTQNILFENYTFYPDEIYIQGNSYIIDDKNRIMNLTNDENYITMKWNYKVTDCMRMFDGLLNVIEIDLTNFDLSEVTVMNLMFRNCHNLEYIKFNNTKSEMIVTDMSNMFDHCISLKTLDLSNFNSSQVSNMISTFSNCWSLSSLNLNGFNTSSVVYFVQAFYNCISLTSLDLSSFDTSKAWMMNLMFFNCSSLTSLNLLNFKTSKVHSFLGMFGYCSNLISLNLSNFDISSAASISNLFINCSRLISLDISNFNISNVEYISDVFNNCYNLQYINISNFIGKNSSDDNFSLKDVSENITYCFNSNSETTQLLEQLKNKKCSINYCSNDWIAKERKIIKEKEICVFDCSIDSQYKFEFRKECYQDCPEGTYLSIENNKCIIICEENQPFEINENCVSNCSTLDFFNGICTINNQNINAKEYMVNAISNEIIDGSADELLSKVNKDKKDYFVKNNYTEIYHLTSTYNQKNNDYNNVSTIDIGECEEILKEKYGINSNETLMIFKVDFYIENYTIPITEYEIFSPKTNEKLDLYYCNETKIKIYTPILIEEEYLYIYDPNSNYYKDKCYPNSSECVSDDILLKRKNEFNKNYLSLCESNCIFNEYNTKTKKVFCECSFKNEFMKLSEIVSKKNELLYYNFQFETDLNSFFDNNSFTNNINSESNIIAINSEELKECLFKENNTKECEESITYEDLINQNYIPLNTKNSIDKVFELFQEHFKNKSINIKKNEIIVGEEVIFHLTTTEQNEKNNKISNIDLGECEKILQNIYKIEDPLIIFMADIKRNDTNSTQVEYQVFNPNNLEKLNLSFCENMKIDIYSPIKMDYEVYILAKYLKEQGYDIFDSSGDFYNDICSTFKSYNNTDVILTDRRKYFYNKNITLCEDNCQYEGFDIELSKVNCLCDIKTRVNSDSSKIKFSPNKIIENFYKIEKYSNLKIIICYKQVFNLSRLKKNYGSYFMITIGLLFLISMIFISIQLKRKINDILRDAFMEFLSLNKQLNKKETIQKNKEKDDITSKKLFKLKKNKKLKYKNENNNILNSNKK